MNAKNVRSDCSLLGHESTVRRMHSEGLSDAEIARHIGVKREAVNYFRRKRLSLPSVPKSKQKNRAEARRQQERSMGCSPADVRAEQLWRYATDRGWPAGMRKRSVEIIELLLDRGPLTRLQICQYLKISERLLTSNDPQGTHLANLIARGFVASVARAVDTGRTCRDGRTRKGTKTHMYFPTPLARSTKEAWRAAHPEREEAR